MSKYFIVNVARRPKTRFIRKAAPKPEKFMQFLCGGKIRLARKRFQALPEKLLEQFWDQLKRKWETGVIEVHLDSPTGPLFTFEKGEEKATPSTQVVHSEPAEEEEEERPDDSWTKSEIADWLLDNIELDPKPDKSELMKLRKDELLEFVP